jgi:hypothetical protein
MRFIPTRVHGILDYIVGFALIVAPWLFGFYQGGAESWFPIVIGLVIIFQSLMTNYELGISKTIPMSGHLTADFVIGLVLAVSPWVAGYAHIVYWPHLLVGLFLIFASLTTHLRPEITARPSTTI